MASSEINLISARQVLTPEEERVRRVLKVWTPLILGGYLVILITVLGYLFFLNQQLVSTSRAITLEQQAIATREQDEGLYLLLKQKMVALTRIYGDRPSFTSIFDYFSSQAAQGVEIISIKMSEDGNTVLQIKTANSVELDSFVRRLLEQATERFTHIELVSITYKPQGDYDVILDIGSQKIADAL